MYLEIFRIICLQIYDLGSAHFLSARELAWSASLKKTKVKLDLLADTDMLLMVQRSIRDFTLFNDMQKLVVKTSWSKIKNSYI